MRIYRFKTIELFSIFFIVNFKQGYLLFSNILRQSEKFVNSYNCNAKNHETNSLEILCNHKNMKNVRQITITGKVNEINFVEIPMR